MSAADVERALISATSAAPLGQDPDDENELRISIPGAQEKTALLSMGGQWYLPRGATPTTHILKLPLGLVGNMRANMTDSVENEWLCATLLREMGFNVAETHMAQFGTQKALLVTRFDRRWQGIATDAERQPGFTPARQTWIARLPQEDLCQATGTHPDLKYEADGGPSIRTCLQLLSGSEQADADRTHFALTQLAFWLLAATDGHAKNFSIFHRRGGGFASTPLYDVLSAWPIMGDGPNLISLHRAKLAMAVRGKNAHYKLRDIQTRHWHELALSTTVSGVWEQMRALVGGADAALTRTERALPHGFPRRVAQAIFAGVRQQVEQFERGNGV